MIKLDQISTDAPKGTDEDKIRKETKKITKKIAELQEKMKAGGEHSLLVVLQGMDSSGKDGATEGVFRYCSPIGINAHTFRKPTDEEFDHDFLWRCSKLAPRKGDISVFVRSHYEDILIQKVHGWISDEHREKRMNAINAWEDLLQFDNNTTVLKFYMHLSKDRQKEKLTERLEMERKYYKHNDGDWEERKLWDKYRDCYEYVLNNSTIPWHVVPVDQRWYRTYIIAKKVLETMESWDLQWPALETEMK